MLGGQFIEPVQDQQNFVDILLDVSPPILAPLILVLREKFAQNVTLQIALMEIKTFENIFI